MSEDEQQAAGSGLTIRQGLRRWFLQPPRRHGEVIADRTVSFLELFYDLVFVVLVAQVAHTLAEDVSWSGALDFTVVFGLIWIAWFNGSQYHELHGREDGRSRTLIFLQMGILTVLAVYTGHATGVDGEPFAIAYAVLLAVLAWQWWTVYLTDGPRYRPATLRYLAAMAISIVVVVASAGMSEDGRLIAWGAMVAAWILFVVVALVRTPDDSIGMTATDSMVERYGLFIIIVLGEVVVGVVDGLREVELDFRTVATGVLGLSIGFGFWWTYFDFVGRRLPRQQGSALATWLLSQLPIALAVAASGAGMVSLIEHAADDRTPAPTSWLLAGSVAVLLVVIVPTIRSLADYERLAGLYRPLTAALAVGAAVALAVGWARPVPWLLAILLILILIVIWSFAFARRLRVDPGEARLPVETHQ